MDKKITSVADITRYAEGRVCELPGFAPDQPFVARLRRPSLLALVKNGKIPNPLLKSVTALFESGKKEFAQDEKSLSDIYDLCDIFAQAALIEPTYDEIKAAGLQLTDDQLMYIFKFSQAGNIEADNFRNV